MTQGTEIHGYREQSASNVALVNANKIVEEQLLRVFDEYQLDPAVDQRWLAIARTDLERAFMALNRAIFQPDRVKLEELGE